MADAPVRRTMKAIVYERYGAPEVLELRDVAEPEPRPGRVIVEVRAAGVSAGDWHLLRATWFAVRLYQGLLRPKRPVLGFELSGVVRSVAPDVTRFRPGDEVFGASEDGGGFAELASVPAEHLVPKPRAVSHAEAAAVPSSALTALQGLRLGGLRAGARVLVIGASGGVGSYATQLAVRAGAHVTGVASGAKAAFVRGLGAERTLDHAVEDFTREEERYDLVLDLVGDRTIADCLRVRTDDGVYVAVSGTPTRTLRVVLFGGRRARAFVSQPTPEDLAELADLLERGELRSTLERTYPLASTADALRDLGAGRVRGKLAVVMDA